MKIPIPSGGSGFAQKALELASGGIRKLIGFVSLGAVGATAATSAVTTLSAAAENQEDERIGVKDTYLDQPIASANEVLKNHLKIIDKWNTASSWQQMWWKVWDGLTKLVNPDHKSMEERFNEAMEYRDNDFIDELKRIRDEYKIQSDAVNLEYDVPAVEALRRMADELGVEPSSIALGAGALATTGAVVGFWPSGKNKGPGTDNPNGPRNRPGAGDSKGPKAGTNFKTGGDTIDLKPGKGYTDVTDDVAKAGKGASKTGGLAARFKDAIKTVRVAPGLWGKIAAGAVLVGGTFIGTKAFGEEAPAEANPDATAYDPASAANNNITVLHEDAVSADPSVVAESDRASWADIGMAGVTTVAGGVLFGTAILPATALAVATDLAWGAGSYALTGEFRSYTKDAVLNAKDAALNAKDGLTGLFTDADEVTNPDVPLKTTLAAENPGVDSEAANYTTKPTRGLMPAAS